MSETCEWRWNEDDCYYDTECGQQWCFTDSGSLEDHGFRFCHHCGRRVRVVEG